MSVYVDPEAIIAHRENDPFILEVGVRAKYAADQENGKVEGLNPQTALEWRVR